MVPGATRVTGGTARIGWDNPNPMSGLRSGWRHPANTPAVWVDCPTCWGQRQIFTRKQDGLIPDTCPTCLGVGQVGRR